MTFFTLGGYSYKRVIGCRWKIEKGLCLWKQGYSQPGCGLKQIYFMLFFPPLCVCVCLCALSAYKFVSVNVCLGTHTPLHLYPPGVSVTAMAVSVCWTSRGLWCVTASITLSGWTARGVTHSTRIGLGPGPPETLPTSVWVSIGDWFSSVTPGEMYSWGSVWVSIGAKFL